MNAQTILVFGLGVTGQAALRYFENHHLSVIGYDDILKENLFSIFQVPLYFAHLPKSVFPTLQHVILSPGISDQHPLVQELKARNIPLESDINYFAKRCPGKIVGITGSNGKSTVTALTTHLLRALGYRAISCGNFGYPVMQLLDESPYDYYVVELSSYQLEWTFHLGARVGCLLNISPNHLDRYQTMTAYQQAKERLFIQSECIVMHASIQSIKSFTQACINFSEDPKIKAEFHLKIAETGTVSFYQNAKKLITFEDQKRLGSHHYANQLAALAILQGLSLPVSQACRNLSSFQGLPHRIEYIATDDGRTWINDSKSTTTAATLAALCTVVQEYPGQSVILLIGGIFKEHDLSGLTAALKSMPIRKILAYGRDQAIFANAFHPDLPLQTVSSLNEAVSCARSLSEEQDIILLSPACSSLDQFRNFEERGESFKNLIFYTLGNIRVKA